MEPVNPKFKNPNIYLKAKKEVLAKNPKHSAYRSMQIVTKYKQLGGKLDESKSKGGTNRWLKERWKNLTPVSMGLTTIKNAPKCGTKHPNQGANKTICRPTKTINRKTPKLAKSYSKKQLAKAQKMKNLGLRINWSKL